MAIRRARAMPLVRMRLLFRKVLVDVAPPIENVDDLDVLILIAEEDDIALVRHGADVGTQFGPVRAEDAGQLGQMIAPRHQLGDEGLAHGDVAALAGDVTENTGQIVSGRCQIDEAAHLVAVSDQFLAHGLQMRQHVIGAMFAALRDRSVERVA